MLYLLVTAANWSGRRECVTSLPSWSCGFDSRRPLRGSVVFFGFIFPWISIQVFFAYGVWRYRAQLASCNPDPARHV